MLTDSQSALRMEVLLSEVELQCRLASLAAERLQVSHEQLDTLELWGALQSILVASANVSKLLWPAKRYMARGAHLRLLLGLDTEHTLSKRTFRNHFEHYDERVEEWFSTVQSSVYTDQIVGELPWPYRDFPQNAHRHFDPASLTMTFRGDSLNIAAVLESLTDILERCQVVRGRYPAT